VTPTRESPKSAGLNLRSPYNTTVPARGKELMKTDLQIKLPVGCYGRIAPRRDWALFHHIDIGAGVSDEDFCGNLSVLLLSFRKSLHCIIKNHSIVFKCAPLFRSCSICIVLWIVALVTTLTEPSFAKKFFPIVLCKCNVKHAPLQSVMNDRGRKVLVF
jgi:dUTP pyrophosphatase